MSTAPAATSEWFEGFVAEMLDRPSARAHLAHFRRTGVRTSLFMDTSDGHPGSIEDRRCDRCGVVDDKAVTPLTRYVDLVPGQPRFMPDLMITAGLCDACFELTRAEMGAAS